MPQYGFYSKSDREKEIISSIFAANKHIAENTFAIQKGLMISEFEKLYEVVEK